MTLACEGAATPTLATGSGSFDYARRLASLRMTLACEGSATPTLATGSGSFDYARKLASLRMTLACEGSATPSARRDELRILRLRSQTRFAQDDTALRERVRLSKSTTKLPL